MTVRSALYVGSVMHRRLHPRVHHFRYRAFWFLLDLDEVDALHATTRLFSHNRPNLFSLYDTDHGDGSATPLRSQVERQLREAGVDLAVGRIDLLCMPRTLGYAFNPISIYFCHQADGALVALVYEVHNTFGERHSYVIEARSESGILHQQCRKALYVSPFMDMNLRYEFRVAAPDQRIAVGISATTANGLVMRAVLGGTRQPFSDRALIGVFLRIPAITIKVIAAIHFEAMRLWLKGLRLRSRPAPPARMTTVVAESDIVLD
jgi:uncharacterized protein